MAERERTGGSDLYAFGVQLLGLVTVLRPASGYLIRLVAFLANPVTTGAAYVLARSEPISQLAVTGFNSVLLACLMLGMAALIQFVQRLPEPSQSFARILAIALVVGLLVFMFFASWTDAIYILISPVAASGG